MSDPFYNRKPVPDEFIEHVGPSGMSKQEEYLGRERKFSTDKGDVRKFSNPKNSSGRLDPHYARKPVPDDMIKGVGVTGLTAEEEYLNREKKYTLNGADVRRFSNSLKGGMEPLNDPYYGRKPITTPQIVGVGDTGTSKAEEYEVRERKQSLFQLSSDPFEVVKGTGHRQSISGVASAGAADARRRSSAVAPDAQRATANVEGTHTGNHASHSGYAGEPLTAIESRNEVSDVNNHPPQTTTTTTTTTTQVSNGQHGLYHDITTNDPDSVAPHETR